MPHTSRKKQQGPQKRHEITDGSGWTHITRGTTNQKHRQEFTAWSPGSEELKPAGIPPGLRLRDVTKSFDRYTTLWKDSLCLNDLQNVLTDNVLASYSEITSCVCLGLGSFTGGDRTETSFFQLAALNSILEILGQQNGDFISHA